VIFNTRDYGGGAAGDSETVDEGRNGWGSAFPPGDGGALALLGKFLGKFGARMKKIINHMGPTIQNVRYWCNGGATGS